MGSYRTGSTLPNTSDTATLVAETSGGASTSRVVSAASTNATSVKTSAGQVYALVATNTNAAVRYLKIYDKASAPTVGTDVPKLVAAIPASAASSLIINVPVGLPCTAGIAFALTTGSADSDTGAVAAGDIQVTVAYK